jgi:hypothetical protein
MASDTMMVNQSPTERTQRGGVAPLLDKASHEGESPLKTQVREMDNEATSLQQEIIQDRSTPKT